MQIAKANTEHGGLTGFFRFAAILAFALIAGPSPLFAQYFFDIFQRDIDPGPISPWLIHSGNWTTAAGSGVGSATQNLSYATAYLTSTWTNNSVEARVRFPVGAYGGGIAGRLNTVNGARYAAWLYPEGSAAGSNTLKLIKFQNWNSFSYSNVSLSPITQATVAPVSTNWHTLKLVFSTNHITVLYDNAPVITWLDQETPLLLNGGVSLDTWRNLSGYEMLVDDVVIAPPSPVARNDNYTTVSGAPLQIAAPGVLGNDGGGTGLLTASLVSQPERGVLVFGSSGAFEYTATNGYTGPDSFTYVVSDGVSNSSPATVNIVVNPNQSPVAEPDVFSVVGDTTLSINAPGVLANDTDPESSPLSTALLVAPTNGTLTLSANGGFAYAPQTAFLGLDSFSYLANDGISNSQPVSVTISVLPGGSLFLDNFSRTNGPPTLSPWFVQAGTWTNVSGALRTGTNNIFSYSFAYVTNRWTNFVAQARLQFPDGGYGGGLGACLDPATGSRYAAWLYPAGSTGGSNVLKFVKFKTWSSFNYQGTPGAAIAETPVPPIGTNWHTLKIAFLGSRASVYYDGKLALSAPDLETQPYTRGGVSLDMWTDASGYPMLFDDVVVDPIVRNESFTINEDASVSIPAPGVLANDTGVFGTNLAAVLLTPPPVGTLTLAPNGGFNFQPPPNYNGQVAFQYRVDEPPSNSLPAFVTITVAPQPDVPQLPMQPEASVAEGTLLVITNTAFDADLPADALSYSLTSTVPGPVISSAGVITWTPSEVDGPGTNWLTTVVVDGNQLRATNVFPVVVSELNTAPLLAPAQDMVVNELQEIVYTNIASDLDLPQNHLTFLLADAPAGAVIDPDGRFRWTPSEADGPRTNQVTVVVVDDGTPPLTATNRFHIAVLEVNAPPALPSPLDQVVAELSTVIIANAAADSDLPLQPLTYELVAGPTGAAVDAQGTITWTPSEGQGPSTNLFVTVVSDHPGVASSLSATNSFIVIVTEVNSPPALPVQVDRTVPEMVTMSVTNTAEDVDVPFNDLSYSLLAAPEGATIDGYGVISWIPSETQGPSTNQFITVVTDGGSPALSSTNSFSVVVAEVNRPPVLPDQANRSVMVTETIVVTNTAADPDQPADRISYLLVAAPPGAVLSTDGVISWTPQLGTENSSNLFTVAGTDNGTPALTATNSFLINVLPKPTITVDSVAVAAESCLPANGAIDPGETVTIALTLKNNGPGDLTNLVVDLLESASVSAPSGPQAFGALLAGAATGPRPFSFTAIGQCGEPVRLRLRLNQDASPLSAINHNINIGQSMVLFSEAFDAAWPPALPEDWITTASGAQSNWITRTLENPTIPNAAFSPSAAAVGVNELLSPAILLPMGSCELNFRHRYELESDGSVAFDGGVLEIRIGTNDFVDVVQSGGVFVAGGYNSIIDTNFGNPLAGRNAWSGSSLGFVSSALKLPANAAGQFVQFRWRCGTDLVFGEWGWAIDSVSVVARVCCQNFAPTFASHPEDTIEEASPAIITNTVANPGLPIAPLSYGLVDPPAGASIDSDGLIHWTPTESQGPGTYTLTTIAQNTLAPTLAATNAIVVVVLEKNSAPVLPLQPAIAVAELSPLAMTNTATDDDLPQNQLSYELLDAPIGVIIDTNGVISWTPTEVEGPGSYEIKTRVHDGGTPALSATNSFLVEVGEVNTAPVLPVLQEVTIAELATFAVTNTATDPDIPANQLRYELLSAPTGAIIDANGVITWTPTEVQGPGSYEIVTAVYDDGAIVLSDTNSFLVHVTETNSAPMLPAQGSAQVIELTSWLVTNTATDIDSPANHLTYELLVGPSGATIDTNGVISWTPTEGQGPGSYVIQSVVYDDGDPSLRATNSFLIQVMETNAVPILPAQDGVTIAELSLLVVTNAATDADLPANHLSYELLAAPAGATIDTNGLITWTPTEEQGPGTYQIQSVVYDDGEPTLRATNSFLVQVTETSSAPFLPAQDPATLAELDLLILTNTATDADLPANHLSYELISAPLGATIDTNGVITWTPTEAQGPGDYEIRTVAYDDGTPALSVTNSFSVSVTEINSPPLLPIQPDVTIPELALLTVTNAASDSDLPANSFSYTLLASPAGAGVDAAGVITWTPDVGQGPSTNEFVMVVNDNGSPSLRSTNQFMVRVLSSGGPLQIQRFEVVGSVATLVWNSIVGQRYKVQYCDDLNSLAWIDAPPEIQATSALTVHSYSQSAPARFYRVLRIAAE